jgi:choline dehydrogenase-like flavoprotein
VEPAERSLPGVPDDLSPPRGRLRWIVLRPCSRIAHDRFSCCKEIQSLAASELQNCLAMIVDGAAVDGSFPADVCIVGAGPAGLALAFKCARRGLRVVVLEAGDVAKAPRPSSASNAVDITTEQHAHVGLVSYRGLGGTSRLWGGRCVALDDIDFEARHYVPFSGWPISHAEIAGHYEEALAFLGSRGDDGRLPSPIDTGSDVSADLVERWSAQPDLTRLHTKQLRTSTHIKTHLGCTVTEIRLDPDGRQVVGLGVRSNGDTVEVKAKNYVLAGGGLENARLLLATQRKWPEKFGGADGALGRFYGGHLTGYLATIQFEQQAFAKRLWFNKHANRSYSRRRLGLTPQAQRQHQLLNTAFWPESFSVSDPAHGSGALSMIYLGLAFLGIYPRLGRSLAPSTTPRLRASRGHFLNIRHDPKLLAGIVQVLSQLMLRPLHRTTFALANPQNRYLLRYHGEQLPNPQNRVTLSNERDDLALPRLRIDFRFLPGDVESVVKSHQILDRSLQRAGIARLDYLAKPSQRTELVLKQALDGYHQIGLTRMSTCAKDGVVDGNCRVHDVANLYVAGSSVFPTGGQANPTLPAVALALRLGDHLSA